MHETPLTEMNVAPPGVTPPVVDQVVPFHFSENGAAEELPTAMQLVALAHDTAFSVASPVTALVTFDHVVPFHRSMPPPPAAKQFVGLGHETPASVPEGRFGLGLGEIVHDVGAALTGAPATTPPVTTPATPRITATSEPSSRRAVVDPRAPPFQRMQPLARSMSPP